MILYYYIVGAKVTVTDREQCLEVLRENVAFNNLQNSGNLEVQGLDWGEQPPHLPRPIDVILGKLLQSDNFYNSNPNQQRNYSLFRKQLKSFFKVLISFTSKKPFHCYLKHCQM